ncbi:MAG: hypothetical protein M3490_02035 [Chloroflexota bacterium]|nr:hypothetical protein [Chloroflexota bacterium]
MTGAGSKVGDSMMTMGVGPGVAKGATTIGSSAVVDLPRPRVGGVGVGSTTFWSSASDAWRRVLLA